MDSHVGLIAGELVSVGPVFTHRLDALILPRGGSLANSKMSPTRITSLLRTLLEPLDQFD